MKAIKTNFFRSAGSYIAIIALSLSSCELDEDLPGVNETVLEIEGVWDVVEESEIFKTTNTTTYEVTISADPDNMDGVIIDNFYDVGISIKANVSGSSLIIPNQNAEDGYSVHGSGTISNNRQEINMDYVVNDGSAQDDHATAVYTKI